MPTRPPQHRAGIATPKARHQRLDAQRAEQSWRHWYWTQRWRKLAKQQIHSNPLCAECDRYGKTTPATVCDHVIPHRGNEALFWNGPFQSLCKTCHDSAKRIEEHGGTRRKVIGPDGVEIRRAEPST